MPDKIPTPEEIAAIIFEPKNDYIPVQADNAWCRDYVADAIRADRKAILAALPEDKVKVAKYAIWTTGYNAALAKVRALIRGGEIND